MLEDRFAEHDKEVVDKYHDPDVYYEMTTLDYVMRPYADGVYGPFRLVLPPVADAKGRFYSIVCRKADAVNTVTITDKNDSECWLGDVVMDGKCDRALFYSDGLCWIALGNRGWPGLLTTAGPGTTASPVTMGPTTWHP